MQWSKWALRVRAHVPLGRPRDTPPVQGGLVISDGILPRHVYVIFNQTSVLFTILSVVHKLPCRLPLLQVRWTADVLMPALRMGVLRLDAIVPYKHQEAGGWGPGHET